MVVSVSTIANLLGVASIDVPVTPTKPAEYESWDEAYVAFWQLAFEECEERIEGFFVQSLLAGSLDANVESAMRYVSTVEGMRRHKRENANG